MRTCTKCGDKIIEGYIHEEFGKYFCTDQCLDKVYPGASKMLEEMSDEDLEESVLYYTSWEDEGDTDNEDLILFALFESEFRIHLENLVEKEPTVGEINNMIQLVKKEFRPDLDELITEFLYANLHKIRENLE